ncbi:MAG: L,D-transpeptidase, partial [Myxococcota bacterium]
QVLNGISDPRRVRVGQLLRIPVEPVRTVIHRSSFLMGVYVGDTLFRTWWIAHGKPGPETTTPVGTFKVTEKVANPDWYGPDAVVPFGHPDNPLGTHFVKVDKPGYGIHGTWEPNSIRQRASLGCIRLENSEIAEYFALVPRTSAVTIR